MAVVIWVLPCPRASNQDDAVDFFQEAAAMKLARQRLVDLVAGEVEAIETSMTGKRAVLSG